MSLTESLKAVLPPATRRWLRARRLPAQRLLQRLGLARSLVHRVAPINPADFGESRGQCIDRYYIENFLLAHAGDVQGRVLEFGDDTYTRRFGGSRVTKVDVLHLTADNPHATIVADLEDGENIPSDTFDCIICTQVLHCIFDVGAAIRTLYRVLKPGGVVLVTDAGIQKVDSVDLAHQQEYWRFTSRALRRMFEEIFPRDQIDVQPSGNVLAAIAFLHGLAVEDLRQKDLDVFDRDFELSIGLRAVKPRTLSRS